MKAICISWWGWLFSLCLSLPAQTPVITSLSQNGELVCSNLYPGTVATVEWAAALTGPWTNSWAGLEAVTVGTNGAIRVSVPMFYRVRGMVAPTNMVLIPEGGFTMGDAAGDGNSSELPLHSVYLSKFYMDEHEVTKALWDNVYDWATTNGYTFAYGLAASAKGTNHAVGGVSWIDAAAWCNARSQKEGLTPCYWNFVLGMIYKGGLGSFDVMWTANGYRLPTEAEWEKAARGGGVGHRFPWADAETIQHARANYYSTNTFAYDTSPTRGYHPDFATGGYPYTSPVGSFTPNGYGVYDMAGSVWEWCWDWYDASWYSNSGATLSNPHGPTSGSGRVMRGGSWATGVANPRVALRSVFSPSNAGPGDCGFRCVRAR